jgi:hypothetical protein
MALSMTARRARSGRCHTSVMNGSIDEIVHMGKDESPLLRFGEVFSKLMFLNLESNWRFRKSESRSHANREVFLCRRWLCFLLKFQFPIR